LLATLTALGASAQTPAIGVLDFYGLRKVSEVEIRRVLGFKEGDPLPKSKADIEEALENVKNVVRARLEAVCCDDGKAILYVGIEERAAAHFDYNPAPAGDARLPEEIHSAYAQFLSAVNRAARRGDTTESLAEGHSLLSDAAAREQQLRFVPLAEKHFDVIRDVLSSSADEEHRAMAAYVLGYTRNKRAVIGDLQAALKDPDDTVRNNAMRSLAAIAVLGSLQPPNTSQDEKIAVPATWFIEMLDSLVWSDRATALNVLVTLTEQRDRKVLDHLREQAMRALAEMARWKHLEHALPAFILLGRVSGTPETAIQAEWAKGERARLIERATAPQKKK
jgi:hypothetical protein